MSLLLPDSPRQVLIEQLRESLHSSDPLDIVNAFMRCPSGVPMLHPYWERRLCALAELIRDERPLKKASEE